MKVKELLQNINENIFVTVFYETYQSNGHPNFVLNEMYEEELNQDAYIEKAGNNYLEIHTVFYC